MAQASQDKIRAKVQVVREMVPKVSNDQIVLVLQYYDNDVERAIAAFLEDGAQEALQQWHYLGSTKVAAAKKKKKKNRGQKNQLADNGHDLKNGGSMETAIESADASSDVSTPSACLVEPTLTVEVGCNGSVDEQELHVVAVSDVSVNPATSGTVHCQSSDLADHQKQSRKVRDRISGEVKLDDGDHSSLTKRPHVGLEKSCKDLHRQTVSLERLKVVLGENVDKSFKRVSEVFKELRELLNEREQEIVNELSAVKKQANTVLLEQQDKALALKQLTDRAQVMSDQDLADLRARIKHFVSERKTYEDLSLAQRFTCDVGRLFDEIRHFGEVIPVKLATSSDTRRVSVTSSVSDELARPVSQTTSRAGGDVAVDDDVGLQTASLPNYETSGVPVETVDVGSSSRHVVTQSDSLTRYEEMEKKQRVAGSGASNRSATRETSPRKESGRRRGSPRRGVGHQGRGGRQSAARPAVASSHDTADGVSSSSVGRTFFSRTTPSASQQPGTKSLDDVEQAISSSRGGHSTHEATAAISADARVCNGTSAHDKELISNSSHLSDHSLSASHGQSRRFQNGGRGGRTNWQQRNGFQSDANGQSVRSASEKLSHKGNVTETSSLHQMSPVSQSPTDAKPQRNNRRRSQQSTPRAGESSSQPRLSEPKPTDS